MILKLYVFYVFVKVNSFTIHVVKTQKCQCSTKITSIFLMLCIRLGVIMFNATFNNISAMLWRFVLLVMETVVPAENHQPDASN